MAILVGGVVVVMPCFVLEVMVVLTVEMVVMMNAVRHIQHTILSMEVLVKERLLLRLKLEPFMLVEVAVVEVVGQLILQLELVVAVAVEMRLFMEPRTLVAEEAEAVEPQIQPLISQREMEVPELLLFDGVIKERRII